MILNGIKMVYHHVCYKEIHGYDLVILMPFGEHIKLHRRLRRENKCNIPVDELENISMNSKLHLKLHKSFMKKYNKNINKIRFSETLIPNINLREDISYNYKTGTVTYTNSFEANHNLQIYWIDIK